MSRLKGLRTYVDAELNKMEDTDKRTSAIAHMYGVSLAATMIANKRGLDPEIASMADLQLKVSRESGFTVVYQEK